MDKVIKNKSGLELVTSRSLCYETSLGKFLYVIPDHVWWCNIKLFLSYSKNSICKLILANSWHHILFHFHLCFCIWKLWKGKEKITKLVYLKNEKNFFDAIKNIFMIFEGLPFGEKIKIWKNSRHRL